MVKKLIILLLFMLSIGVVSAAEYNLTDPLEESGLTVDEFKEQCIEVTYKDLKTNDSLINKNVKLTGVVELASHNSMTFTVDGDRAQSVYVRLYEDRDNAKFKKYEGLDATIYGRFDGVKEMFLSGEEPYITIVDIE